MNAPKTTSTASRHTGKLLLLFSGLLLAGCSSDIAGIGDSYVPTSTAERYPIRVGERPVKMNIDAKAGALRGDQVNGVINFAQDARGNSQSRISVRYASGSAAARNVAKQTVQVLAEQGVPRGMISTGSYQGSGAVVSVSFMRKVAITKECGDWSEDLAGDSFNEPYPNQGCAVQQNIAAMVANPEDFETPHPMSPVIGSTRSAALDAYAAGGAVPASSGSASGSGSGGSGSSSGSTTSTTSTHH